MWFHGKPQWLVSNLLPDITCNCVHFLVDQLVTPKFSMSNNTYRVLATSCFLASFPGLPPAFLTCKLFGSVDNQKQQSVTVVPQAIEGASQIIWKKIRQFGVSTHKPFSNVHLP